MATINVRLQDGTMQPMSYPDDWSDDQVKAAIYKNFPPAQEEQPKQGWHAVAEDIGSGIRDVPAALGHFLAALPGQAYSSGKQVVTDPLRAILNIGGGVRKGLEGAINTPSNIAQYLSSRGIGQGAIEDLVSKMRIPESDLEQRLLGAPQEGDVLLQGLGSFAPYARIGGAARGLSGLAKRAAAAGAYGAGQDQNPITAALMGMAGEGLTRGAQRALRPGNLLPSTQLTPEQLADALRVAQGTETSLGNVIENPGLKKHFENKIAPIPLSGANDAMQRTANVINQRGEDILSQLKGNMDTSDIGLTLRDALKSAERETRQQKNELFKKLNDAAEDAGINTDRSNMRQVAKEELGKINEDPDLATLTDSATKKLLQDLASQKDTNEFSLKNTDFLRGKLGKKAHDAYMAGNSELGDILGSLRDAAVNDIDSSITKTNNPHLNELRDNAMDFYRKEWVPFEDKDIIKFTRKNEDPDLLIQAFIKNSRLSDRSRLLEKLAGKLNPEEKNLMAHSYLSNQSMKEGNFSPLALRDAFKRLGDRQKEALFGKDSEILNKLRDFSELAGMNTEPLTVMFNPKTGARQAGAALPWGSSALGVLASLYSHSLPVGAAIAMAPILYGKPAAKLLTSPGIRERIINRLIKAKQAEQQVPKNLAPYINALMQSSQTQKPMELELNNFAGYEGQGENNGIR